MTRIIIVIILLAVTLHRGDASAAKLEQEQVQGILYVESFNHDLGLSYMFNNHEDPKNSKQTNQMIERYRFSTVLTVVNPSYLRLSLSGDVGFNQNESNSSFENSGKKSTNSEQYQYSLSGVSMDQGIHPISFKSSRTISYTESTFSSAYTTDTRINGVEFSFIEGPLKVSLAYEKNLADVTNNGRTTSTNSNSFILSGNHSYGLRSLTALSAGFSWQRISDGSNSENYNLGFANTLNLGNTMNHKLTSTLKVDGLNYSTGIFQKNIELVEALHSDLGKALRSDIRYDYVNNSTTGISGSNQENTTQSIDARLQHQLFQSLQTSAQVYGAHSQFLGGYQDRYSATFGANYVKKLPSDSKFVLNVSESLGRTERHIVETVQVVRDERHTVVNQGDVIPLNTSGDLASVVRVYQTKPLVIDYVEVIDYVVDSANRSIVITPGGGIAPGTQLLITYVVRFVPSASIITDNLHLSGNLSLLGGRYVVTANANIDDQNQLGKSQSQSTQYRSRSESLGVTANFQENTFGLEAAESFSGQSGSKYLEGAWQFRKSFYTSQLFFGARERYTLYDATARISKYGQNTLNITSTYNYNFDWAQCSLTANYINNSSGSVGGGREYVFFRGTIRSQFNKLSVSMSAQSLYRISSRETTRDDSVTIDLVRTF
jgi:hypothetical protein